MLGVLWAVSAADPALQWLTHFPRGVGGRSLPAPQPQGAWSCSYTRPGGAITVVQLLDAVSFGAKPRGPSLFSKPQWLPHLSWHLR